MRRRSSCRGRIPHHVAIELLFAGRWMGAEEAKRWGLVNEVVPTDLLLVRVREIADLLADGPYRGRTTRLTVTPRVGASWQRKRRSCTARLMALST
jgi:enoyl-CoA hydratase/carnithine racemase